MSQKKVFIPLDAINVGEHKVEDIKTWQSVECEVEDDLLKELEVSTRTS